MSGITEPKDEADQVESHQSDGVDIDHPEKADILHSEVLINADLMNDAVDAENREHEEGLWASVKSHPWACFWAFVMCFTIVSLFPHIRASPHSGSPAVPAFRAEQ